MYTLVPLYWYAFAARIDQQDALVRWQFASRSSRKPKSANRRATDAFVASIVSPSPSPCIPDGLQPAPHYSTPKGQRSPAALSNHSRGGL